MSGILAQFTVLRLLQLMLVINLETEARPQPNALEKLPVVSGVNVKVTLSARDTLATRAPSKSGLFNKESGSSRTAVGSGWFLFGLYVLVALFFSGLSGYIAVSKGLNAAPYFFMGFFFSAFGFLYVLTRPTAAKPGEVPAGLVKVRTTLEPIPCPKCGNTNHPAAKKCLGCGAELQPSVQSEVMRVK